ncbi:hypothetical protein RhiirA5_429419 [Rhizophagus irregularis]|uniref:Uncharacterized protein n=1 Tax=Rhizophagus irregularis TaxID=588596 RepID=A0A2N0NYI4_9GLOM|nr:hypothetical protein RhiirA5_429419 [Rhizophagus irregularis]
MKLIVFIIVLFLKFFNTFAFVSYGQCIDHGSWLKDFEFPQEGVAEIKLMQPYAILDDPNLNPCCLQQGVMIIEKYEIYKDDGSTDPTFAFTDGRTWGGFKCDQLYEGDFEYTRRDNFDGSKLTLGENLIVKIITYAHCFYGTETNCYGSCKISFQSRYSVKDNNLTLSN